ncbi:hypothetical protein B0T18DRAFT_395592, partial [Schizothecium vesticola]
MPTNARKGTSASLGSCLVQHSSRDLTASLTQSPPRLNRSLHPASQNIPGTTTTEVRSFACQTMRPDANCHIPSLGSQGTPIIAIHGLETESPRTWEFKKKGGGGVVNWLSDRDMLPAALPKARIFTYDWDANCFADTPVQTLLGHADTLLGLIAEGRGLRTRPIIFVASCFRGLILAVAINRAAQEGSPYRYILLSTVGILFLATPFHGSDAAKQARWHVVAKHDFVRQRVQKFTEIANAEAVRLPMSCFFETRKTEMLRRLLSRGWAKKLSTGVTHKI